MADGLNRPPADEAIVLGNEGCKRPNLLDVDYARDGPVLIEPGGAECEGNSMVDPVIAQAAADIVAAYLEKNEMPAERLPGFVRDVIRSLTGGRIDPGEEERDGEIVEAAELATTRTDGEGLAMPTRAPAVDPAESIHPDYLICLEDGAKRKMLKRHLRTLGLTPAEYRRRWNLPADYPMVAPNYARLRSRIAEETGLVRRPDRADADPEPKEARG